MAAERLRTLIVDDEPLAVERMQILCAGIPQIDLIGTASDGEAALRLIDALSPDLVLLDVAMPQRDGLAVATALADAAHRPAVIFCTAFEQHAVAAFDVAAVDYVLKPVSAERLARAVARAADAAGRAQPGPQPASSRWIEEFWVPHRSEMIRLSAADIDRIDAERDYMRLSVGGRGYLIHQTISELERRLDPAQFVRLHRSTIVRKDRIAKLRHDGLGVWHAELRDGELVRIGRTYQAAAKAIMAK
ncbi:LytTR family DNA-binding domain-containing protein [Sphingomonas sp. MG17]|uniref:LytTR family DNA-binding domain-containing protein n=1 Tax=Sphingomonas tagetis TaxID=2949092 RepID=A0A9X2HL84_9SPHN|nr:LytTR family DNA-binding domain-containing protein [Sphingomonas tagetis]MCP3729844.1 LytTR family DNA-binding domain-containing protein [Sphingomonas tagetis]